MPIAIPNTLWPRGRAKGNLVRGSNSFDDTSCWTRSVGGGGVIVSVTPNYAIAPDGTQTACRFVATKSPSTGYAILNQIPGNMFEQGKVYTVSVWAKSNTDNPCIPKFYVYKGFGSPQYTIGGIDPALTGEWKRYIFPMVAGTYKVDYPGTGYSLSLGISGGMNTDAVDMLLWGCQIVEGYDPGAYVETGALAIPPDESPINIPKTAPSSPTIFSMQSGTTAELETEELYNAELSPKFGWNVGVPSGGYWKIGDLIAERTPYNPQLRICSTEANPNLGTGAWKNLLNSMGLPREVIDFNSMDDMEGWTYNNLSDVSTFPTSQPLTAAQMTVANSKFNQQSAAWLLMLHPASQAFADGVFQINCKPGYPSGPILRAGSNTQAVLMNWASAGGGVWNVTAWQHGGGAWASTGITRATPPLDPDTFYTFTYVMSGTTISLYVENTLVGTYTNASLNPGGTRHGWRQNGAYQQHMCWVRFIPLAGIDWSIP